MPYLIDDAHDARTYVMRSHIRDNDYVTLAWPKLATLADLDYTMELITMQINIFRKIARRETLNEELARLEYESWLPRGPQP